MEGGHEIRSSFFSRSIAPCAGPPAVHVSCAALLPAGSTAAIHQYLAVRALGGLPERYLEETTLPTLARLFGFGVNDEPSMNETLAAIHDVLAPGWRLMVGWDKSLVPDPSGLSYMRQLLRPKRIDPLPAHKSFPENLEHVHDCLAALPA